MLRFCSRITLFLLDWGLLVEESWENAESPFLQGPWRPKELSVSSPTPFLPPNWRAVQTQSLTNRTENTWGLAVAITYRQIGFLELFLLWHLQIVLFLCPLLLRYNGHKTWCTSKLKVYKVMTWNIYICKIMAIMKLRNTSITLLSYNSLCVVRTFKSYSPSTFQVYNALLLTIVTLLYTTPPELLHLTPGYLYPFIT